MSPKTISIVINAAMAAMVLTFTGVILAITKHLDGALDTAAVALVGPPMGAVVAFYFHSQSAGQGSAIRSEGAADALNEHIIIPATTPSVVIPATAPAVVVPASIPAIVTTQPPGVSISGAAQDPGIAMPAVTVTPAAVGPNPRAS